MMATSLNHYLRRRHLRGRVAAAALAAAMLAVACGADATVSTAPTQADVAPTAQPAEPTAVPQTSTSAAGDETTDEDVESETETDAASATDNAADDETQATDDDVASSAPVCGIYVPDEGSSYTDDFEIVDCSEPHNSELAGQFVDIGGGDSVRTPESDVARAEGCGAVVAELTGRPATSIGVEVGIDENRQDGSNVIYDCWAWLRAEGLLTRSLTEAPIGDLLPAGVLFLPDAVVGRCYISVNEDFGDLATESDCEGDRAELFVGVVQLSGPSTEYDKDATVDQSFEQCDAAFGEDYNTIIYPDERGWTVGQRDVYCTFDAAWAAENEVGVEPYCLYIDLDESLTEVDCDEPHNVEYAGTIPTPFDVWPETQEATNLAMWRACVETVEAHYGRPLLPVLRLEALPAADPDFGEPADTTLDCYTRTPNGYPSMTGFVPEIGLDAALGDVIFVADLEPGTCFTWVPPDFYSLGYVVDCDSDGAVVAIGTYIAEDRPYPGLEGLRIERQQRCQELLDATDLAVDPETITGTVPIEFSWDLGIRLVSCEADPA